MSISKYFWKKPLNEPEMEKCKYCGYVGGGAGIVRKNNGINVRNAGVRCAKRFADKIKRSDNYTVS